MFTKRMNRESHFTQEKGMCINCQEFNSVPFIMFSQLAICKDPNCIFVHNTRQPKICVCCGDSLPFNILHDFCGSGQARDNIYLKKLFAAYRAYRKGKGD